MKQLTLLFEAQDTWFFQELRPGKSLWLTSLFPPPVRVFEGAVRSLLQQVSGQPNALAGNLRIAGPWPCLHADTQWQRLYPWPLHILEQRVSPAHAQPAAGAIAPQRALLRPAKKATRCDLGWVRLPELPTMPEKAKDDDWQAPKDAWLKRDDFIALLADCQAHVSPVKLADHLHRETRLGIARVAETGLSEEGRLFQTEHVRLQPTLAFAITLRVSPNATSGLADEAQELFLQQLEQHIGSGRLVRLGAEGRMARVTVLADAVMDEAILPPSFDGKNLVLVATSAMDFDGHWLPQDFTPDANQSGQAQSWSGIFHACGDRFNLRLLSAVTGKRQVEGSTHQGKVSSPKGLGQGARALVPAGSVWFGQLLHGDFKRLARARLGMGKKLGRGEFALATWKEGDA